MYFFWVFLCLFVKCQAYVEKTTVIIIEEQYLLGREIVYKQGKQKKGKEKK